MVNFNLRFRVFVGNWSPYIPRNLILRYTAPGEIELESAFFLIIPKAYLIYRNI
jgi:hypothetical protein